MFDNRDITIVSLKEANMLSKQKIHDLESQILVLKSQSISNISSKSNNTELLEQNLRTERQAALAIAQHDGYVIAELEKENRLLRDRKETDKKIIEELVNKVSFLMNSIESKDIELNHSIESLNHKDKLIETLEDRLKKQGFIIFQTN